MFVFRKLVQCFEKKISGENPTFKIKTKDAIFISCDKQILQTKKKRMSWANRKRKMKFFLRKKCSLEVESSISVFVFPKVAGKRMKKHFWDIIDIIGMSICSFHSFCCNLVALPLPDKKLNKVEQSLSYFWAFWPRSGIINNFNSFINTILSQFPFS